MTDGQTTLSEKRVRIGLSRIANAATAISSKYNAQRKAREVSQSSRLSLIHNSPSLQKWHQFVRNEEIAARIGLPPLSTTICCNRSAIFGQLARLGDELPAHKALYSCVKLSQGRLPDPTWKRRPGHPRGRWIDQLRRDNNRPPADQWKLAIKRGHGGRAMLRSHDYATT